MTDPAASGAGAGALLKAAREQQGLHIAALAAAIKVTPRKLDALENDRLDELPDATFARALAQTVCRYLKIDATPVLERLPHSDRSGLDPGLAGLNTPFRGRAARDETTWAGSAVRPLMIAALLLMVAALVVFLLPPGLLSPSPADATATVGATTPSAAEMPPAATAASGAEFVPAPFVPAPEAPPAVGEAPAPAAAPGVAPAATTAAAPAAAASGALQLRTSAPSWIQVRDGDGRVLLSRTVTPDEALAFDGPPPLRLIVGNAAVTEVRFRGQPVDLAARSRENVARFELP